jgi:hypothetical protein
MILHLGVIDVPYVDPNPVKAPKASPRARLHKRHHAKYRNITTGDVATFLENRYHVFENFYHLHEADIASDIENSLQGAVETLLMGGPPNLDAVGGATSSIENRFKEFLSNREMDRIGYPGVPTEAAERGVSHRFKNPYKRRAPRPSFIDTGLFSASMKSWID